MLIGFIGCRAGPGRLLSEVACTLFCLARRRRQTCSSFSSSSFGHESMCPVELIAKLMGLVTGVFSNESKMKTVNYS